MALTHAPKKAFLLGNSNTLWNAMNIATNYNMETNLGHIGVERRFSDVFYTN